MADLDREDSWGAGRKRFAAVAAAGTVLLALAAAANLCMGSIEVPLGDLATILASGPDATSTASQVIWQIRLPRILEAALLGGALALSGFLLQTFFNNPIASPYVLGISSGAKFVLALVMVGVVGAGGAMASWQVVGAAFAGALAATGAVLLLSRRIRSMGMLIVAGVMVGYVFSAATDFLITFADDQNIVNLHNWSLGSFSGAGWADVRVVALVVALGSLGALALSKSMAAYQLGEGYARSAGVNVGAFRTGLIAVASLLSACVTAYAGPVSFVGIAVPYLARCALGSSKPLRVIPACLLGGAIFCLVCDLVARTLFAPVELNLSAVTAVFGAPVVIALMVRRQGGDR